MYGIFGYASQIRVTGIEPMTTESKSVALPLRHTPLEKQDVCCIKCRNQCQSYQQEKSIVFFVRIACCSGTNYHQQTNYYVCDNQKASNHNLCPPSLDIHGDNL